MMKKLELKLLHQKYFTILLKLVWKHAKVLMDMILKLAKTLTQIQPNVLLILIHQTAVDAQKSKQLHQN